MGIWFLCGMVLWAVVILLLRSRVYVHIQYHGMRDADQFDLRVRLFDLMPVYHMRRNNILDGVVQRWLRSILARLNLKTGVKAQVRVEKKSRGGLKAIRGQGVAALLERLVCERLYCRIAVHGAQSDRTALLYGGAQCLAHGALRYLACRMRFARPPRIFVRPEFQSGENSLDVQCILSTEVGNIIAIVKKLR